jgi:hypothetical protein
MKAYFEGRPTFTLSSLIETIGAEVSSTVILYGLSASHIVPPITASSINHSTMLKGVTPLIEKGRISGLSLNGVKLSDGSLERMKLYEIVRKENPFGFVKVGGSFLVIPKVVRVDEFWLTSTSHKALTSSQSSELALKFLELLASLVTVNDVITGSTAALAYLSTAYQVNRPQAEFDVVMDLLNRCVGAAGLEVVSNPPNVHTKLLQFARLIAGFRLRSMPWTEMRTAIMSVESSKRSEILALNENVRLPLEVRENTGSFKMGDDQAIVHSSLDEVPAGRFIIMNSKSTVRHSLRTWATDGYRIMSLPEQDGELKFKGLKPNSAFKTITDATLWAKEDVMALRSALVEEQISAEEDVVIFELGEEQLMDI